VSDQYAPNNIFVNHDRERARYVLSGLPAAEARIAPLHLDNRGDQLF
jgi:hypothetical protein